MSQSHESYLWDRSGEPDREVEHLERLLGSFRYSKRAPPSSPPRRRSRWWPALALAAAALLVAAGLWLAARPAAVHDSWHVSRLQGTPRVGDSALGGEGRLRVGEWLETDEDSRALVRAADIGRVEVDPRTRIRLLETSRTEHRLDLARGTIHATVVAPPRLFFVETPSAVAVDLGCIYTLEVDDSGAGLLSVSFGKVSFERDGRESIVPRGARCRTYPGIGPGTPYFEDAPERLQRALESLDFGKWGLDDLDTVLTHARPRDTLTLWHLLPRVEGEARALVYDRLAALSPPPDGVGREGVLRLERAAIDRWRSDFDW
jgi:hypothetical protein